MTNGILARAANVALILASAGVCAQLVYSQYSRANARLSMSAYHVGDRIGDSPELDLRTGHATLLLMTASTCHFCTESMPFYRKLIPAAGRSGVRVIGISNEEPNTNRSYLTENGIAVARVVSIRGNHLKGSGTPTLILVRNNGTVAGVWSGKLDSKAEGQVLDAIAAP